METVALFIGWTVMVLAGLAMLAVVIVWLLDELTRRLQVGWTIAYFWVYRKQAWAWIASQHPEVIEASARSGRAARAKLIADHRAQVRANA